MGYGIGKGRKPGSLNQRTETWKDFRDFCLVAGLTRFTEAMNRLDDNTYTDRFLKLLEFHKPKLQRSEVSVSTKPTILLSFPDVDQRIAAGTSAVEVIAQPTDQGAPSVPLIGGGATNDRITAKEEISAETSQGDKSELR